MSDEPQAELETTSKPFYASSTFWAVLAAAAAVIFDFQFEEFDSQYAQAVEMISLAMALRGRVQADTPINLGVLGKLLGK